MVDIDAWSLLSRLSWGWPREWEELVIIAGIALAATLLFHLLVLFVRITVKVVVGGLLVLLVYSIVQSSRVEPLMPSAPPPGAPPAVEERSGQG